MKTSIKYLIPAKAKNESSPLDLPGLVERLRMKNPLSLWKGLHNFIYKTCMQLNPHILDICRMYEQSYAYNELQ